MSRGTAVCILIILLVTLAAAIGVGWPDRPQDWFSWLGRVTGVVGLASMLVAGVLSVRIPGIDRPFGGLTRLWILHHRLGLVTFVSLLAHAPLMALSVLPHGYDAMAGVLLPPAEDSAMWAGWIGLIALIAFLSPSFRIFGHPRYQRWKAIHFIAGIALVAGLLHGIPLTRNLAPPWPEVLWGSLGGLALLVFLWRATVARHWLRRDFEIIQCDPLASRVVEISLRPDGGGGEQFDFRPGQFVYLTPLDGQLTAGRGEEHPYTISSAPGERELRIAIKDLGDASAALQEVRTPSPARVEGPYGDFLPERLRMLPQLWIGGGIGITPFISAARAMARGMPWGPVELIYCANDRSRAYFLDELTAVAGEMRDFRVHTHYFSQEGPLTEDFITAHCSGTAERVWFVCGPVALARLVRNIGRDLDVPWSRIHSEEFSFL